MQLIQCWLLLALFFSLNALAANECEPVANITPFCGIQAPEDLELSPDGGHLLLSQFGGLPVLRTGGVALFDLKTGQTELLYPQAGAEGVADWGSDNCPGSPGASLSPHGIHLSRRSDGQWQLLVVNHGGRESIEYFSLQDGAVKPSLQWRGCVLMPPAAYLNDVVGLPEGGFLATNMMNKDDPESMKKALSGELSGHLWQWQPGQPVTVMAGSESAFPNGIQISADGRYLFVNLYIRGEVWKIDRDSGKWLTSAKVAAPDNSLWADDGRLLVASHRGEIDFELAVCSQGAAGFCPLAFSIVAVDPVTMDTEVIFSHDGSAPMGAVTVALKITDKLYLGSFAGDRLYRVQLPEGH